MGMETFIQYSTRNLLASYEVYLCFNCNITVNIVWYGCLILWGSNFRGFLFMIIYEVLYK